MPLLLLSLGYAGLCALCLAMARHHRQCWGSTPSPGRARGLRIAGSAVLAGTAGLALVQWGIGSGLVRALVSAGIAGVVLIGLLSWRPRWAVHLAWAAPLVALAGLLEW